MAVKLTLSEISEKYDRFARWYDLAEGIPEALGLTRLRKQLLRGVSGKVLEVAAGTGKNLRYYPHNCQITGVDLSKEMLKIAQKRASSLSMRLPVIVADAENLPFANESFDTVISTLSTCTFPTPLNAIKEMRRVCKRDGQILLLEHGRSSREWLGRWQDRHEDSFAKRAGCHWNREPLQMANMANLKVTAASRRFFGIFHLIEAKP
jgi:ubiquinone/menaquinone biosynthesis C-methylase UbiE